MQSILLLEQSYPTINWREPVAVKWLGHGYEGNKFACRVCVAHFGLKDSSTHQWETRAEAEEHIKRVHLTTLG
jgi:hypothetical protein